MYVRLILVLDKHSQKYKNLNRKSFQLRDNTIKYAKVLKLKINQPSQKYLGDEDALLGLFKLRRVTCQLIGFFGLKQRI